MQDDTDHMQETVDFRLTLTGEGSGLDAYTYMKSYQIHTHVRQKTHSPKICVASTPKGSLARASPKTRLTKTDLLGILKLLHEARVLADTRDVERLGFGADRVDEVVVLHRRAAHKTLDLRCVLERHGLLEGVDVRRRSLNHRNAPFLVASHVASGLDDGSWAERACSYAGQKRSEKEVVARADDELNCCQMT